MLLQFINRESELDALEQAYKSKKAEFFVIYGRRRVGKTELIKKFSKNKKHFYFLAKKQDLTMEKEELQNKISEKFDVFLGNCKNFEELFQAITNKLESKEKLVIIIDEFPYWIAKDEKVLSEFQYLWDELLKNKNIFLIVCGSYVSVMEEKVLSKSSPLYGRRTGQLKVEPMKIKYLRDFLPNYNIEDLVKVYGALGTIPFYLKEFDSSKSFFENIKTTFLNKANILNKEAEFLLKEELRETNVYFNILKSIIDGATRTSEIASKSRVDITNINKYLSTLIQLKLVRKVKPITSPPKEKKYIYQLEDNYFRFWLSFIYPYQTEIEEDVNSVVKLIQKNYNPYLGHIFEEFCKKIIRFLPLEIHKLGLKVGKWWHKENEIDICAINEDKKEILFGECKWQDKVDPVSVLEELKEKAKSVDWFNEQRKETYCIFAKSFKKKIKEKNVHLFDLKDLGKLMK